MMERRINCARQRINLSGTFPHIGSSARKAHVTESAANQLLVLNLPIEVVGCDLDGMQFIEPATTLSISCNGALILLKNKLAPESELVVRNLKTDKECLARVVGMVQGGIQGHIYGVAIPDGYETFWGVEFSPTLGEAKLFLKCGVCEEVVAASLSAVEMNVFQANKELARSCETCNAVTIWKQSVREIATVRTNVPLARNSPAAVQQPREIPHSKIDKRGNKRAGIKAAACIRYSGIDTVVACEDMSRGGFRFRSERMYPPDLRVEVSVPYAKSSNNIFMPARIIYLQELPGREYRHGVAYIKTQDAPYWKG